RGVRAEPANARRGVPRPHRPTRRRTTYRRGGRMTLDTSNISPARVDARDPVAPDRRPVSPSPASVSLTFAWRTVLKLRHVPEQLTDVVAVPVIFTVLFTYLFGGALAGSTGDYLQFLLPGTLAMTVVMVTMYTGVGVNTDIATGVLDRFRA